MSSGNILAFRHLYLLVICLNFYLPHRTLNFFLNPSPCYWTKLVLTCPEHRCSRLKSLLERRGPKELGNLPQVTQWRQDQGTELASSSSPPSSLSLSSSLLSLFSVESFSCARHIDSLLQLALGPNSTQELHNYSQRGYCYRQNACVPPSNSSFEAITPSVMGFGGGTSKR